MMTVPTQYLSVTLEGIDLRATRRVYAGYDEGFAKLARYFNALATDWRGWNGSRYYESIEGDLRIQATHDGHVNLRVLLRESAVPTVGVWKPNSAWTRGKHSMPLPLTSLTSLGPDRTSARLCRRECAVRPKVGHAESSV